jgi:hypothetical protein
MIDWVLGAVGLAGVGGIVALGFTPMGVALFSALWASKTGKWVLGIGAIATAVAVAYLRWRSDERAIGAAAVEAANKEAIDNAVSVRNDVEATVRRAGDGTASDELHKSWSRPN